MKFLKYFESYAELLAPNGKISKLSDKLWKLVRTYDFINWFGEWEGKHDSKIGSFNIDKHGYPKIYNLDANWEPKIFYHGTNRMFDVFSDGVDRSIRNDLFQGNGFFFTDNLDTAWRYAEASINQQLLKDEFFKSLNANYPPHIIEFVTELYKEGFAKGWDNMYKKYGEKGFFNIIREWEEKTGSDVNRLCDLVELVEGANVSNTDEQSEILNMFSGSGHSSLGEWVYEEAEKYHFKNALPNFTVVKAFLKMDNPIVSDDPNDIKSAKKNGYDSAMYIGPNCVDDREEYVVYNVNQIKVIN